MLDLGLEHLGVDVGSAGPGVEAVLKACGESAHFRAALFHSSLLIVVCPCSTFSAREPGDPVSSRQGRCTGRRAQEFSR
jgi:hypothetical protein